MRVRLLSSCPADLDQLYLTAFVIDDAVAIDSGTLGVGGTPGAHDDVGDVFLTHSHADHVGTLPIHVEDRHARRGGQVTVNGHPETIASLRAHVFNDVIWPDLERVGDGEEYVQLVELENERQVSVRGLRVMPVAVDHTVPTFGYIVDDGDVVAVFGGDSGPTERIWELAAASGRLRAAFLEASFPNRLHDFAVRTAHLTPALLAAEVEKLPRDTEVIAVHIKPAYRAEIVPELEALGIERLRIGGGGQIVEVR